MKEDIIHHDGTVYTFKRELPDGTLRYEEEGGHGLEILPTPTTLPNWAVGFCHSCGLPADDWDFFGEPICRNCGG